MNDLYRPADARGPYADDRDDPGAGFADDVELTGAETSGHPAVDAVIRAMANAADLSPADQIAEYEAAHRTLQETLATIDQV